MRGAKALRNFDAMLSDHLDVSMKKSGKISGSFLILLKVAIAVHKGINVVAGSIPQAVSRSEDGTLSLHLENGTVFGLSL